MRLNDIFSLPVGGIHYRVPILVVVPATAYGVHCLGQLPDGNTLLWTGVVGISALLLFRWRTAAWWGLTGWVCVVMFVWRADIALTQRITPPMEGVDFAVSGQITSVVTRFKRGRRFNFRIADCVQPQPICPVGRQVRLNWYGPSSSAVDAGQWWQLNIRLKRPHGVVNPDGFDAELRALQSGIDGVGYVRIKPRSKATNAWQPNRLMNRGRFSLNGFIAAARDAVQRAMNQGLSAADPAVRGTIVALVTGNQSAIPAGTWTLYNRTGTSHLMSISGLHVTMFAALAVGMSRLLLRLPLVVPTALLKRIPASRLAWFTGLMAALAYSAFSGWGIPAQRTCWMLAGAGLILASGRHCGLPFILALAAAVVVLIDPWAVLSAGFWLSFVAVLAIVLYGRGHGPGRMGWFAAVLRTQWAATVALLPLGAVWFGSVSLVSPLANGVAIPIVSMILTPLAMLAGLCAVLWNGPGQVLLNLAAWMTAQLLAFLNWIGSHPDAVWITGVPSMWVLVLAVLGAVVLLWPLAPAPRLFGVGLLFPLLFLVPARQPAGHWQLLALDVGQGSSILVRTARHSLLFDTGPGHSVQSGAGDRLIAPLLRAQQIRQIDKLILSHSDTDHTGGAFALISQFQPSDVLSSIAQPNHAVVQLPEHRRCQRGMSWQWDGVRFTFLHPGTKRFETRPTRNNHLSCVLKIEGPGGSALLTGDIERGQEKLLTTLYGHAGLASDVLLAPHHGSATSSTPSFLDAVKPRWAVFQAGYRNRFRHPAQRVLDRYHRRNIATIRSDADGAAEFRFVPGQPVHVLRHRKLRSPYWRLPVAVLDGRAPQVPGKKSVAILGQ